MGKKFIKLAISCGLIATLLWLTDVSLVWQNLTELHLKTVLIGVSLLFMAQVISSWRWQWILRAEGEKVPFFSLLSSYMVGMLVNNFMPSSIGGDVVKVYDVYRITRNFSLATLSVFMERVSGLAVLLILPLIGINYFFDLQPSWVMWSWIALNCIVVVSGVIVLKTSVIERIQALLKGSRLSKVADFIQLCLQRISAYADRKLFLLFLLVLSVPVQLATITVYWLVAGDLGVSLSLSYYLFAIPIITIVSLAPISIGGFGVREGVTIFLFGAVGVSPESAFSISMLQTCIMYFTSLAGGVFLYFRKEKIQEIAVVEEF